MKILVLAAVIFLIAASPEMVLAAGKSAAFTAPAAPSPEDQAAEVTPLDLVERIAALQMEGKFVRPGDVEKLRQQLAQEQRAAYRQRSKILHGKESVRGAPLTASVAASPPRTH